MPSLCDRKEIQKDIYIDSSLSSIPLIWRAPKSTADLQETQLAIMETKMLNAQINLPLVFNDPLSTAIKVCCRLCGTALSRSHSKMLIN